SPVADRISDELASGAFGQNVEVGQVTLALTPDATAVLAVASSQSAPQLDNTSGVRVLLHYLSPGQLEPAVSASGLLEDTTSNEDPSDQADTTPTTQLKSAGELAILPPISIHKSTSGVLLIPYPFSDPRLQGLLVLFSASNAHADDPHLADALVKAAANLADSARFASATAQASFSDLTFWSAMQVAIEGLSDPARRRACLTFLSVRAGSTVCEDLALVADDQTLSTLARQLQPQLSQAASTGDIPAAQWALDRTALLLLDKMQTDGKLPPEYLSVLQRNVGEPAMNPGTLDDIVAESHDSKDLQIRLVAENFNYLEDNSPASRARAFDWLADNNAAPAGYDPLASHQDREAALEKAYDALLQPGGAAQ
ncbi:MAG: hypothetical protein ABSF29_16690, partial [Tepidisphaeraceae bacterium]